MIKGSQDVSLFCSLLCGHGLVSFMGPASHDLLSFLLLDGVILSGRPLIIHFAERTFAR